MARIKRHRKMRKTCFLCGKSHTRSQHKFHGRGSFARTHGRKKRKGTRKRKAGHKYVSRHHSSDGKSWVYKYPGD